MALISITFDPQDSADIARARTELDRFCSVDPEPADLRALCEQMLDPRRYGDTRRGLVRAIAEASPAEASRQTVYEVAAVIDPDKNPGQMVGGLHGNLETSWRSLGGPGEFLTTSPTGFRMRPELAAVVLEVLDGQQTRDTEHWEQAHG